MTHSRDRHLPEGLPPLGEVHVYHARLDPPEEVVEACAALLAPAERLLVRRRVTEDLVRRATVSRGLLRLALGGALERAGGEILLHLGKHGRPLLRESEDSAQLDFNVSHTGETWIVALTATGPIGIDVEAPRDETDWDALVDRYFSAAEGEQFRSLPGEQRKGAFFRTWVSKEAFLKARGSGLTTPLREFDVEVRPDQPVALCDVRIADEHAEAWWLTELPEQEFPTVVAGRGTAPAVMEFDLDWDRITA